MTFCAEKISPYKMHTKGASSSILRRLYISSSRLRGVYGRRQKRLKKVFFASIREQQEQEQNSIHIFDGDTNLPPLVQTRITLTCTTPPPAQSVDDDPPSTCSYFLDVVKPPSVEDLYDWYTTNNQTDNDESWANVWETEVELIRKYIEHDIDKEAASHDIIIEVGAGLSFAGLLLAKHFRKKCLLLDREPLALHCALSTAKVNGVEVSAVDKFEDVKEENKGIVAAAMFDWSKNVTRESLHLKNKARTIIGADVLYDPETCTDLANACSILGEKVLLCELRRERAIGLQAKFFDECEKLGATKCEIDEDMSSEEYVFLVVEF